MYVCMYVCIMCIYIYICKGSFVNVKDGACVCVRERERVRVWCVCVCVCVSNTHAPPFTSINVHVI
jgi:hypothetical protein